MRAMFSVLQGQNMTGFLNRVVAHTLMSES